MFTSNAKRFNDNVDIFNGYVVARSKSPTAANLGPGSFISRDDHWIKKSFRRGEPRAMTPGRRISADGRQSSTPFCDLDSGRTSWLNNVGHELTVVKAPHVSMTPGPGSYGKYCGPICPPETPTSASANSTGAQRFTSRYTPQGEMHCLFDLYGVVDS